MDALERGVRPRPRVEIWPRGGAKSSTAELGAARVCVKLSRRFVLYVSETQDQADRHVQSIAALLEQIGVERALNQYGTAKGWRRQELRTANGFNVAAFGLDTGLRGIKLDQYRPDLIIFDDIDNQADTPKTVDKKIAAITGAIMPAGSSDCAYLFLQNKIHEDGIVAQLSDGRAEFLADREVFEEPAIVGLTVEAQAQENGANRWTITGGIATWEGQNLETCQRQVNDWGLTAFQREAQHEVKNADGYFFNIDALRYIDAEDVPPNLPKCRAWDLAATEGGGDRTAGVKISLEKSGRVFVLDIVRGQWGSDNVRKKIGETAAQDGRGATLHLPQDPGQAGKDQAQQFKIEYKDYRPKIEPVTGDKATRATGFADAVNKGNVYVVRAPWNAAFREELKRFREDGQHLADDQVDAAADAYNELTGNRKSEGWRVSGAHV